MILAGMNNDKRLMNNADKMYCDNDSAKSLLKCVHSRNVEPKKSSTLERVLLYSRSLSHPAIML